MANNRNFLKISNLYQEDKNLTETAPTILNFSIVLGKAIYFKYKSLRSKAQAI